MGDDNDMYGSSLSAGRLLKLKGMQLKRESELLICISMIRRSEYHLPSYWRDVLIDEDNNNEDNLSIGDLNNLWKASFTSPLSDETLGAICIRVGPISKKCAWDNIDGTMIKSYSLETIISKKSLIQLLSDKEQLLDIVSIQIGRSSHLLSVIDNQQVTPSMMKEVLKNIGVPGFPVSYAMILIFSANLCDKKAADAQCVFSSIINYCVTRSTNMVGDDLQGDDGNIYKISTKSKDSALVSQLQMLIYPTLITVKKNDKMEIESKHILSIMLTDIESNELGQVFKYSLRKKIGKMFLNIDEKFLTLIVDLWSSTPWVYPDDVEAFICPNGYSLSVRMPLGSFRTNRVIKPMHSTEFLYTLMEKRLFFQLKKHRVSDYNLRVPNDIKIYADAKRTKFVPKSSRKSVIEHFEGNSRIYVWSDYVMNILDLEKSQKVELETKPSTEEPKKEEVQVKKKLPPTTADAALERLLSLGVPIVLPPRPPFPGIDHEAHKWSIPLVISYLEDEIELPEYKETFQRHDMTGYKFICLNQSQLLKEMDIELNMHAFKLAAYATRLREKVFENSALNKPKDINEWQPEHLAGWLHYSQNLSNAAFSFFKARLSVSGIRASDISTVFSVVSPFGVEEEEFTIAADAIKKLIDDKKIEEQKLEEKRQQEEKAKQGMGMGMGIGIGMGDHLKGNKGDKNLAKKKETAMKRRKREEDNDNEDNDNENRDNNANSTNENQQDIPNTDIINNDNDTNKEKAADTTTTTTDSTTNTTTTTKTTKKKGSKTKKAPVDNAEEILIDTNTNTNIINNDNNDNNDHDNTKHNNNDNSYKEVINNNDTTTTTNNNINNNDNDDDDEVTEKKKKKKKNKKRFNTNNDININEIVLEATSSLSSSFRQKISNLEQLVFDQNKSVEDLRNFADKLRKEKEEADERARKLAEEKELAAKVIENLDDKITALEADKIKASDMITMMTTKYLKHVEIEKKILTDQIIELANTNTNTNTNSSDEDVLTKPSQVVDSFTVKKTVKPPVTSISISSESPISFANGALSKFIQGKHKDLLKPISLDNLIDDNYDQELEIWEMLLDKYQFNQNRISSAHDTRALVARVSSLWLRLGHRMISDAHSKETDKNEAKALLALEKCARVLFSLEVKEDIDDDDLQKLPPGIPSIINPPTTINDTNEDEKHGVPSIKKSSSTSSLNLQQPPIGSVALADKCNNYVLASGMVFCLGLLRKLMERHQEEKLVFVGLIANVRKGSMPFTELSRENFRVLVEQTLGISFGKWDKFDAVCQRIDPEKKGFVNSNNILKAFQNISPVMDVAPKSSTELAETIILFTLTASIDQLVKSDKEIDQAFLHLISTNAKKVPSFESMIRKANDIYYDSDDEDARNAQVITEIQFVADILYELVRPFFDGTDDSIPSTYKSKDDHAFESSSSLGKGKKDYLFLSFMKSNAQECCLALARGLQVYEGKGQVLLAAFSTLMITFLIFRRMSLQSLVESDEKQLSGKDKYVLRKMNRTMIKHTLAHIDSKIIRLLGKERGEEILKSLSSSSAEQFEFLISELVGLPIPINGVLGLVTCQREIEMLMMTVESLRKNKDGGNISSIDKYLQQEKEKSNTPAYLDMLDEVRLGFQIEKIVDKHIAPSPPKVKPLLSTVPKSPTKDSHVKVFDPTNSQLIREIDKTLYNQRIDHLSQYMEYLNVKASTRRKILQNLLILWNSLKSKQKVVNKGSCYDAASNLAMNAIFKDKKDLQSNIQNNSDMFPPLVISTKEIEKRTLSLQKGLLEEIQKPIEPMILNLEKKVQLLRKALTDGELIDNNNNKKLTYYIQEIGSLESVILQSSNDCLQLSTKIIKKCNE